MGLSRCGSRSRPGRGGEGRGEGGGGREGRRGGELGFSHSLSRSLFLKGPRGTTGWARGPRWGLRGRGQGERERRQRAGGEGGRASLFLNSASTRFLALWFLGVVYSIFLFLRRPSPLRVRAEAQWFVGSGRARGSLAGRRAPGGIRELAAVGRGVLGGVPRRRSSPEGPTRPDTLFFLIFSYL